MVDLAEILKKEPDYSHLNLTESEISVTISKPEKEAVLTAFDRGLDVLDIEKKRQIEAVLAKLKDQIWS